MTITVLRKNIRSMRLQVNRSGQISLSIPFYVTNATAEAFIAAKQEWIQKAVDAYQKKLQHYNELRSDSVACLEGFSNKDYNPSYSTKWKETALNNYRTTARQMIPLLKKHNDSDIYIRGRTMRSLWGSCNRSTKIITLNWALLRAPQKCIDYVVFHELTHLLYPHHDYDFYHFIEKHIPDYKTCSKILDNEIGLI